jgi:hypothetical protein
VVKRYVPGAVQSMKGRCAGVGPRAAHAGRMVYKHFSCGLIILLNGLNYIFDYHVHVTGAAAPDRARRLLVCDRA